MYIFIKDSPLRRHLEHRYSFSRNKAMGDEKEGTGGHKGSPLT